MAREEKRVVVARVRRPHGLSGEVLCDDLTGGKLTVENGKQAVLRSSTGEVEVEIQAFKRTHKGVIYKLSSLKSRTDAEEAKGAGILLPASELPELPDGEYYLYELVDLPVYDETGKCLGQVTGSIEAAGNDLLVIDRDGAEHLVPLVKDHIKSVEPGVRIVIRDIPWE